MRGLQVQKVGPMSPRSWTAAASTRGLKILDGSRLTRSVGATLLTPSGVGRVVRGRIEFLFYPCRAIVGRPCASPGSVSCVRFRLLRPDVLLASLPGSNILSASATTAQIDQDLCGEVLGSSRDSEAKKLRSAAPRRHWERRTSAAAGRGVGAQNVLFTHPSPYRSSAWAKLRVGRSIKLGHASQHCSAPSIVFASASRCSERGVSNRGRRRCEPGIWSPPRARR